MSSFRRSDGFRGGDRSEYLAQFLLSKVAQAIPVPRQEDWGIDFLGSLLSPKGQLLYEGRTFSLQVKSDEAYVSERVFGQPSSGAREWPFHEVCWFFSRTPFPVRPFAFVFAVADKEKSEVRLYTTS